MADQDDDPGAMARAALEMAKAQREEVDKQIDALRASGATAKSGIESAVLVALSNRELATTIFAATEISDSGVKALNRQIQDFTTKADRGTNRLATWTKWLVITTAALVIVVAVQTWVLWAAEPMQVIAIPSPPKQ